MNDPLHVEAFWFPPNLEIATGMVIYMNEYACYPVMLNKLEIPNISKKMREISKSHNSIGFLTMLDSWKNL